jgi:hypothetical protein
LLTSLIASQPPYDGPRVGLLHRQELVGGPHGREPRHSRPSGAGRRRGTELVSRTKPHLGKEVCILGKVGRNLGKDPNPGNPNLGNDGRNAGRHENTTHAAQTPVRGRNADAEGRNPRKKGKNPGREGPNHGKDGGFGGEWI